MKTKYPTPIHKPKPFFTASFSGRSLHSVMGGLSAISFCCTQKQGRNKKDAAAIPNATGRLSSSHSTKSKIRYAVVTLSSIAILLTACHKKEHYPSSIIKGTATPIYLPYEGGDVQLTDYVTDITQIDSVTSREGYTALLSADKKTATLNINPQLGFVSNLSVWTKGIPNDIPIYKSTEEAVTFTLPDPDKTHQSVMIKGQFNGWVPERSVMQYNNGTWQYTANFNPGEHQYLYVIDGEETLDPTNPEKVSNGIGGMNSVLRIGSDTQKPHIATLQHNENSFTLTTSQPIEALFAYHNNQLIPSENISIAPQEITIQLPQHQTAERSSIRLYAYNKNGRANDIFIPLQNNKIITDVAALKRTDFHTQIMYFLMVDRFNDGDKNNTKPVANDSILPKANYFGGDLQGVIDKIDDGYFQSLGINTIWLSPITQNPEGAYGLWEEPLTKFSGYHGYWPISNTKIDYRFGNETLFKTLLEKAHAKNTNVILDYVANHVHQEHPLYKAHPNWATDLYLPDGTLNTEKWDSHRLTTWFDTFLPTLDFSKPEVVAQMTDSAAYWVTHYDLDGFRHDATKHIDETFWRTLTQKVKTRTDRPIYQVGETYGSYELIRSYINTGMLDAQFDFNLYDAAVNAFARNESSFKQLESTLLQGLEYYGSNHLMGNITGNQDRARFISYASGDVRFDEDAKAAGWTRNIIISDSTAYKKLEMLHAFNLTTPGIPCIYYGDEYGSPGGNDPDNRRMMKFEGLADKEIQLRDKVSALITLRKNNMALLYGTTRILRADDHIFIIKRQYFDEEAIIIFNKSETRKTFDYFNKETTVNPMDYTVIFNR
ncbi:MAG: alpha-amylase family glycosyl hydrolase [Bacteroidota bacterium]